MDNKTVEKRDAAYRVGNAVIILLIAMTIGEFLLGRFAGAWTWALWGVAVIKAFFIIRDYMHFPRLFGGAEE